MKIDYGIRTIAIILTPRTYPACILVPPCTWYPLPPSPSNPLSLVFSPILANWCSCCPQFLLIYSFFCVQKLLIHHSPIATVAGCAILNGWQKWIVTFHSLDGCLSCQIPVDIWFSICINFITFQRPLILRKQFTPFNFICGSGIASHIHFHSFI